MYDAVEQPTTEQVRFAFIDRRDFEAQVAHREPPTDEESGAAFDAWLAEVRREAWDEGREAEALSWKHVFDGHPVAEGEMCGECEVVNPYRKGQP